MQKRDALSDCHPLVGAVYFAVVLAFSMVLTHPVSVLSSLAGALGYAFCLRGRAALRTLAPETVIADPLYQYILPENVQLVRLPHFAFSGRCFQREMRDIVRRKPDWSDKS